MACGQSHGAVQKMLVSKDDNPNRLLGVENRLLGVEDRGETGVD